MPNAKKTVLTVPNQLAVNANFTSSLRRLTAHIPLINRLTNIRISRTQGGFILLTLAGAGAYCVYYNPFNIVNRITAMLPARVQQFGVWLKNKIRMHAPSFIENHLKSIAIFASGAVASIPVTRAFCNSNRQIELKKCQVKEDDLNGTIRKLGGDINELELTIAELKSDITVSATDTTNNKADLKLKDDLIKALTDEKSNLEAQVATLTAKLNAKNQAKPVNPNNNRGPQKLATQAPAQAPTPTPALAPVPAQQQAKKQNDVSQTQSANTQFFDHNNSLKRAKRTICLYMPNKSQGNAKDLADNQLEAWINSDENFKQLPKDQLVLHWFNYVNKSAKFEFFAGKATFDTYFDDIRRDNYTADEASKRYMNGETIYISYGFGKGTYIAQPPTLNIQPPSDKQNSAADELYSILFSNRK